MDDDAMHELLDFFKALIDPDRLAIAGRLAGPGKTIEWLAAETDLSRADVQRHLDRLVEAGLVRADRNVFALDRDAIHGLARKVLSGKLTTAPPSTPAEKVLADYSRPDGTLKEIPVQLKKKLVIYERIIEQFEPDRHYTEKEVNDILKRFHPDFVSIRRDLFDLGFLDRSADGSAYSRTHSSTASQPAAGASR